MNENVLNSKEIDSLATLVEESARATKENINRFIEPASGTLRRCLSKRHHIVFGRRGSGKTSLLLKASADLTNKQHPIAYVDLEPYKGHRYPDVLISVLIETFRSFHSWLADEIKRQRRNCPLWKRIFARKKCYDFEIKRAIQLIQKLTNSINQLDTLLYHSDRADLQKTSKTGKESTKQAQINSKLPFAKGGLAATMTDSEKQMNSTEIQEKFKRSKIEFLFQNILNYQDMFKAFTNITAPDCYLFLDDIPYPAPRSSQTY